MPTSSLQLMGLPSSASTLAAAPKALIRLASVSAPAGSGTWASCALAPLVALSAFFALVFFCVALTARPASVRCLGPAPRRGGAPPGTGRLPRPAAHIQPIPSGFVGFFEGLPALRHARPLFRRRRGTFPVI